MKLLRLDKLIADNTEFSRKEIAKLIKSKAVKVNAELAQHPSQKVAEDVEISIYDQALEMAKEYDFIILNKPLGYVCTRDDPSHPTIFDLLPACYKRFQAIGRLDLDTTGIICLTSNGQVNHRLTSPRKKIPKTYEVFLADPYEEDYAEQIAAGILLKGEKEPCLPGELEVIDDYHVRLTIYEGKYHQVRRMFAALGNKVEELDRCQIGNLSYTDLGENGLEQGEIFECTSSQALALIIGEEA